MNKPRISPHPLNLPLLEEGEGDFLPPPSRSGSRCGRVGAAAAAVRILLYIPLLSLLTSCQSPEKTKMEQYYIGGKEIFEKNCANCHQKDGKGLQNLYPPIAGSDYLKNKAQVILAIKYGLVGEIKVNGKIYNQPMPANSHLQNLDIAEVVTYIYNEWGNEQKITTVEDVEKALRKN